MRHPGGARECGGLWDPQDMSAGYPRLLAAPNRTPLLQGTVGKSLCQNIPCAKTAPGWWGWRGGGEPAGTDGTAHTAGVTRGWGGTAMGMQPWGHRWGRSHGDAVVWMRPFSRPRHRLLLQHRPHPHPPPFDDRSPITNPLPAPYRFDTALHAPSAPPGGPRTPPLWPTPPTPTASPARAQRSSHPIPLPPTPHPIGVPLPSPARGEAVGLCRAGGWVPRGGGWGWGGVRGRVALDRWTAATVAPRPAGAERRGSALAGKRAKFSRFPRCQLCSPAPLSRRGRQQPARPPPSAPCPVGGWGGGGDTPTPGLWVPGAAAGSGFRRRDPTRCHPRCPPPRVPPAPPPHPPPRAPAYSPA